jgi:hypothetical protein
MSLGFHERLLWHVHFVGKVGNHERNYVGNYVWERIPLLLRVLQRDGVLKTFLSFMENHC